MDKMDFWKQQHSLWKLSGMSQGDFCKLHGFSLSTFCRWRCKALKAQRTSTVGESTSTTKITLVPAAVMSPQPMPVSTLNLELCSPSGWKLIIAPCMGERFLTRLLEHLS